MATLTRIDRAIHQCVRSALGGPKTPLATLATSLDELRNDPSWNAREIRQIQSRAYWRLTLPHRSQNLAQLERA